MQNNCKLLWIDKQINNQENSFFQKRLKNKIQDCSFLDSTPEALKILKNQKQDDKFIIIISGQFIYEEKEHLNDNLIVFCGQSKRHLQQFLSKNDLLVLVDSGIEEVEEIVSLNEEFLNAKEYLHQSFGQKALKQIQYYHQFEATSFRFLLINKKLEKNQQPNEELMNKEIQQFISQDIFKICQVDMQKKEEEKKKENQGKFSILEKFIYYYSRNEIYQELNKNFAESNFEKLEQIMCVLFQGYSQLQLKQLPENKLYRGISFQELEIYNNIMQDLQQSYKKKQSIFWNTLASTSTKEEVAKRFCTKPYKILFEITLNQQNPHPYFQLKDYNSEFPNEGEVILFPQFEFKVVDIYSKNGYQYVKIEQADNNFSMSLDSSKRQKYWTNKIEMDLKPKLKTICSFYQKRVDFIIKNIMQFPQEVGDLRVQLKLNLNQYFDRFLSLLRMFYNDYDNYKMNLNQLLDACNEEINFAFILENSFLKRLSKFITDVSDLLIDQFLKIIQKIFNIEDYKIQLKNIWIDYYSKYTYSTFNYQFKDIKINSLTQKTQNYPKWEIHKQDIKQIQILKYAQTDTMAYELTLHDNNKFLLFISEKIPTLVKKCVGAASTGYTDQWKPQGPALEIQNLKVADIQKSIKGNLGNSNYNLDKFKNFQPKYTQKQIIGAEAAGQLIGATIVDAFYGQVSLQQLGLSGTFLCISSVFPQSRLPLAGVGLICQVTKTIFDERASNIEKAISLGKQVVQTGLGIACLTGASSIGGMIGAPFGPPGVIGGAIIGGIIGGVASQLTSVGMDNCLKFKMAVSFNPKNKSIERNGILISPGVNPQVEFSNVPDKVQNIVIICNANQRMAWRAVVNSSIKTIKENQLVQGSLYIGPFPHESDIAFHAFGLESNDINIDTIVDEISKEKINIICYDMKKI
ncbi:unnamed protein product [Paramecium octaurelia]|uniref:Uncharacterized protein n=1 Tax=Paramecium octaurelia TaxID=43137 RepID=A0A8S1TWL8_PAROT|nr:unnamed protein product [Paramecium octaurelia]